MKSKKAVIENLVGLGIGITVIAFVIVIGIVILSNFADSQSSCAAYTNDATKTKTFNVSSGKCYSGIYCNTVGGGVATLNTSDNKCLNATYNYTSGDGVRAAYNDNNTNPSYAAQSAYYGEEKLSNNTGGFLTWIPIVIPAVIGIAIIGLFLATRRNKGY